MNTSHLPDYFNETQWLNYYFQSVHGMDTVRAVYTVSIVVIFVAGVLGNVVTCLVIYCDRSMHTVTNYYLFNLAVSDLVVLIAMVVEMAFYNGHFLYPTDTLGDVLCKVNVFMVGTMWNNGILIMTALAVERYAAIVHPLSARSRRVPRRVARVMAGVWSAAVLETLPDVYTAALIQTKNAPLCFVTLSRYARVISGAVAVGTFLLPLVVMLYFYVAIAVTINARQKKKNGDDIIFNHPNHKKRINKLLMALTLSFLACWLPYFSLRLLVALGGPHMLLAMAQYWELWYEVVCMCAWFSSVLNPLLFSLMSTKFRKALKNLWYTKLLRRMERVSVWI